MFTFDRDNNKKHINPKKHDVSFEEARKATKKEESSKTGVPYQSLINLYLIDCVKNKKKLNMTWE